MCPPDPSNLDPTHDVPQQAIATGIAQVYKDTYGRGPQRVVATIVQDVVFVVLNEINTPGQGRLVTLNELDLLNAVHDRIQHSLEADLRAVIERVIERKVQTYVPGYNGRDDVAVDTFILEPEASET